MYDVSVLIELTKADVYGRSKLDETGAEFSEIGALNNSGAYCESTQRTHRQAREMSK